MLQIAGTTLLLIGLAIFVWQWSLDASLRDELYFIGALGSTFGGCFLTGGSAYAQACAN